MKFFGHRGASAREAENTLASLSRALAESDGAEFDVQRTSDNVLVVLHDDTLARTAVAWNNNNSLSEAEYFEVVNTPVNLLSWATVRSIRVGSLTPLSRSALPSTPSRTRLNRRVNTQATFLHATITNIPRRKTDNS